MVSKQTCTSSHQTDQSLWQTLGSFGFLHSSHKWIQVICHVGNTAQQCRSGLFQDSDFAGDLEDSKSTSGGTLCIFRSHTFVPISWMCKKQTSDSHRSTESEIMSLDAGLRMDGLPALDLWDLVIEVLHSSSNQLENPETMCSETCCVTHHQENKPRTKLRLQFSTMILNYATSIMYPQTWSLLNLVRCCTFLKIMKPWSRWLSRPEVQQWDTYPEPKELRLSGYLTESTWTPKSNSNMLTPKTNSQTYWQRAISHVMRGTIFSICSMSAFSAQQIAMSKRMRQGTGEEIIVAKWKPTLLGFAFCGKLSYSAELECIQSPRDTQSTQSARFKPRSTLCRETCRWRFKSKWRSVKFSSVANRCKVERTCEETRCCRHEPGSEFSRSCQETSRWKCGYQRRGRLGVAAQSPHVSCQHSTHRNRKSTRTCDNNSSASQKTKMEDLGVHTSIWRMFMIVTQQTAVHLGNDYLDNLHTTKNQPQRTVKQLFDVTRELVREQTEIQGTSLVDWEDNSWKRTTLFSDSVLCMGGISESPVSAWKEKIVWLMNSSQCRELDRIDGEPKELEWKYFPGFTSLQILAEIQNMMTEIKWELEQFHWRIIFMPLCHDIVWRGKGNEELCIANSQIVAVYARRFARGHWSFLGLGSEKSWYGTHTYKPNEEWYRVAEDMMLNFSESGHPVFRGSSALDRGDLESKGKGNLSFHFCGDDKTAELVLRTIICVNQLSTYGAVADYRISGCSERTGELVAQGNPETTVIPTELSTTNKSLRTDDNVQGNLLHNHEQQLANLPYHLQLSRRPVRGTVFHDPRRWGTGQIWRLMPRVYFTSRQRSTQSKRMDPWEHEDRSSFGGGSQLSSRPLRTRDHHRIFLWWWNLFMGTDREWNQQIRDGNDRKPKTTTSITYIGECTGNLLLKWDRNKHQWRQLLLQRQRCHITCVFGLTWKQVRTTRVVWKCQKRWSGCFDTILQYFEQKVEQSSSELWHRCFVQNLRLLSFGQFELDWIICKKEEDLRRDFSIVWIHSLLIPSNTFEQFNATLEENTSILHCKTTCYIQAAPPSTSTTLEPLTMCTESFNLDWFLDVHRSLSRDGLRRDTAQNCSVQKQWWIHQNTVYWSNLRVAQS